MKPNKVVWKIGKKYVYKRAYGKREETHTLVGCASAEGTFIPPFVIFKGFMWNDLLSKDSLFNSVTKISPKAWITTELFIAWFRFLIVSVQSERPIVLLMDSHSAHVGIDIINLAKENQIYVVAFPAHTIHLQGVYMSVKSYQSQRLNSYVLEHPYNKPSRFNINELYNATFLESFPSLNLINAFMKTGA